MLGNSNMGEQFVQNYVNYVNQNILISYDITNSNTNTSNIKTIQAKTTR